MTVADKVLVCSSVNDRGIFFELPAKNTERPKAYLSLRSSCLITSFLCSLLSLASG